MSGNISPYSTLYAFGDSLSDAGNDSILTSATGTEPVSPPYYHTNVPILDGTASESASVFSNGPVWVQDLSVPLGFGTLEPSLLGGNDFAYGGAETGSTPQNSGNDTVGAISLPSQISQFSSEVGSIASTALVTLSIGGNDLFDILAKTTLTAAQQATDVADAVANEVSAIKTLMKDGARNFLIFNVPNLGLVPEVTEGLVNGTDTPSAALDSLATSLSASYDTQLAAALGTIEASSTTSFRTLDSFSLITEAAEDPSAFGLTNTTTPVWSGNFTSANSGTLATTSAAAQTKYLFWDDFHPTAAVHQILADNAQSLVVTTAEDNATVTGAGGSALTLTMASTALALQVQTQLTEISIAIAAGTALAASVTGGALPALAAGQAGLADITASAFVSLPTGYTTAIDMASGPVSLIAAAAGNQLVVNGGTGALTYAAVSGAETVYAGTGGSLLFGGGASLDIFGAAGASTIIGGTGGNTVAGGGGNQLIFASSGLSYTGGAGAATVIGGSGPLNANLGAGGGLAFGSPNGGNTLTTGSGSAILVGGGSGDELSATGAGNDTLIAAGGAETLNGTAGSGSNVFFGGSGADCIVGGTGGTVILAGSGNETLTGGSASNAYLFTAIAGTTRTDLITNFNPATSAIGLFGYGSEPAADAAALASATVAGGSTTVTLTDGTHIVFAGAPTLHSYNFF
jgi:phospholipase/lecithinase/hemolysin